MPAVGWVVVAWLIVNVVVGWQLWRTCERRRKHNDLHSVHFVSETDPTRTWWFDLDEHGDRSWTITVRRYQNDRLASTGMIRTPTPPGPHYRLCVEQSPDEEIDCRWEWDQSVFSG